jgi:SAM-dependent methyltransferase
MNVSTDAMDRLQEQLWGFAEHRVITVAGRTGLLTRLAAGPATPDELAAELGLAALPTGKLVRALAALGLVVADGERYRMVAELAPHFAAGPDDFAPFLEHSHHLYDGFGANLEAWVRGGEWTTTKRTPEGIALFAAAMQAMAGRIARWAVAALDLDGVERLVDIGGGTGTYARVFCEARPGLRATVLDTPDVAALGTAQLAGTAHAGRIDFVGGDYLDPGLPADYDLALLVNVLHQERPERAARMVAGAAACLRPGGRVAVLDFAIDDDKHASKLGALFAINMRSFGDTHPEPAIRGWLADAGLGDLQRIDLGSHRWIITGQKS